MNIGSPTATASPAAAVFGSLILPLPRLGITEELLPTPGLPGSGEWIERPHTAVAGMAFITWRRPRSSSGAAELLFFTL